ncbi:MAG: large conductance mechanosensitive channel protein MscL [Aristaeellaceae bacterium]
MIKEFKEFAFKGNVIDMAVGVVIGSAFTGIVTSIVNDLFTPLIAKITGSVDFTALAIPLGEGVEAPTIALGNFIQAVINFFLIAICVFAFVKFVNKLRRPKVEEAPKPQRLCPYCKSAIADDATRCPHCTSQLD